ncbi:hypothetical protein AC578_10146 [Pseudocercospora eumusae]|uniref:Uncharacterized protein n=1 Tax=Pseudocercospora eumusae TaxID=321146 RepID=A0A139HYP9_9PEZI|nr:hypothetical protein AC578_10146 [Pseudocercospora eumusae]
MVEPRVLIIEIASAKRVGETEVEVKGSVSNGATIEVLVDGKILPETDFIVSDGQWSAKSAFIPFEPPKAPYGGVGKVVGNVVIVVLARDGGKAIDSIFIRDRREDRTSSAMQKKKKQRNANVAGIEK